jgi:hypothetical protein
LPVGSVGVGLTDEGAGDPSTGDGVSDGGAGGRLGALLSGEGLGVGTVSGVG